MTEQEISRMHDLWSACAHSQELFDLECKWYRSEAFRKTTTCYDCDRREDCDYAFDPYNTNGDCLGLK